MFRRSVRRSKLSRLSPWMQHTHHAENRGGGAMALLDEKPQVLRFYHSVDTPAEAAHTHMTQILV